MGHIMRERKNAVNVIHFPHTSLLTPMHSNDNSLAENRGGRAKSRPTYLTFLA